MNFHQETVTTKELRQSHKAHHNFCNMPLLAICHYLCPNFLRQALLPHELVSTSCNMALLVPKKVRCRLHPVPPQHSHKHIQLQDYKITRTHHHKTLKLVRAHHVLVRTFGQTCTVTLFPATFLTPQPRQEKCPVPLCCIFLQVSADKYACTHLC